MQKFATWKYALIMAVTLVGSLLALPNMFGKSPAVQVQFSSETVAQQAVTGMDWGALAPSRFQQTGSKVDFFFENTDIQLQAKDLLTKRFPEANVAVNLLPNTPQFLQSMGLSPMNLGLDLRGGISFLLQVDVNELLTRKSGELQELVTEQLRKNNLPFQGLEPLATGGVLVSFASDEAREQALNAIFQMLPTDVQRLSVNEGGQSALRLQYTEEGLRQLKRRAAEQNRVRMSGRVNSLGVAEPSIQVVGDDRILVQLPGIQDVTQAKELLGSTATLEFYMVDEEADIAQAVKLGRATLHSKLAYFEDGTPIVLKRKVIMSGEHITDATANPYGQSGPEVLVTLDGAGGAQMAQITRENIHKQMATMYVEYVPVTRQTEDGKTETVVEKRETVVNSATIQGQFGANFQITGVSPVSRAEKLAATLRAGSLVAPVYIIEERTIGPSAGQKNIDQGTNASLLGLVLVMLFMGLYYRKLGWYANIALVFNLILLVAMMSWIGATLTLPGIAGIVLTLGMAVDANVLIYERIREELQVGIKPVEAARLGFSNALSTIVDANITTLIVAVMLFSFGAGPIKGFAVTLSLGILTTMFSAIFVTRALVEYLMLRQEKPDLGLEVQS